MAVSSRIASDPQSNTMPVSKPWLTTATVTINFNVQAYHSSLNEVEDARQVGNIYILPIKTKVRGPAPVGTF